MSSSDRQYLRRYLLGGALPGGGLAERFISLGAVEDGICGCAGAAPVVIPGSVLARGVTSRMPGGAAGGELCWVFCAVEVAPSWWTEELFRP